MYNVKRRHITARANDDGTQRHYFFRRGWPLVRLPDPSSPLFAAEYDRALAESEKISISTALRTVHGYRRHWAIRLWTKAKYRPNRECTLTIDDVLAMFQKQGDRCALSGLRFRYRNEDGVTKADPFGPSLDRIDSRGGYTVENCRVVLYAVNVGLNEWGDRVFLRICKAVARRGAST